MRHTPSAVRVAARYAALVGESTHDADGLPLRYPSVLLRTQPDYGEGQAALPRGNATKEAAWAPEPWPAFTVSRYDGDRSILLTTYVKHEDKRKLPSIIRTIVAYFDANVAPALANIGYTIRKPPFVNHGVGEPNPDDAGMGIVLVYFYIDNAAKDLLQNTMVKAFAGLNQGPLRTAGDHLPQRFRSDGSPRTGGMDTVTATTSPLDGQPKTKVLKLINKLLAPHTKGLFRDQHWAPIQAIRAMFEQQGIPFDPIEGSGRYEEEGGVNVRKVWMYQVPFKNQNQRDDKVYVRIVASGSGPVASPLDVYDVVAYAS